MEVIKEAYEMDSDRYLEQRPIRATFSLRRFFSNIFAILSCYSKCESNGTFCPPRDYSESSLTIKSSGESWSSDNVDYEDSSSPTTFSSSSEEYYLDSKSVENLNDTMTRTRLIMDYQHISIHSAMKKKES